MALALVAIHYKLPLDLDILPTILFAPKILLQQRSHIDYLCFELINRDLNLHGFCD